jgi:hypothetical protein
MDGTMTPAEAPVLHAVTEATPAERLAIMPEDKEPTSTTPDPFAPLTDADRAAAAVIPAGRDDDGDDTLEVQPCPEQNPAPHRFRLRAYGEPAGVWFYRDAHEALVCVVARYDQFNEDGSPKLKENGKQGKVFSPWCYGRRQWTDPNGKAQDRTGWHTKSPPTPRPL